MREGMRVEGGARADVTALEWYAFLEGCGWVITANGVGGVVTWFRRGARIAAIVRKGNAELARFGAGRVGMKQAHQLIDFLEWRDAGRPAF